MRNILITVLWLFITVAASAQLSYQSEEKSTAAQSKDTALVQPKKILIIPYEPKMHLSDADNQIAEYSEKNPRQIRAMFRTGLTNQLHATLLKSYPTHSMLANLSPEGLKALDDLYRYVNYSYDTVYPALKPALPLQGEKTRSKNKTNASIPPDDIRYMNVKIESKTLIQQLCEKFDVNTIVFLGQFEIKTKYADCSDASLGNYSRIYKVHYTVFNSDGKQIYGDIAKVSLNSSSGEIEEIMAKAFPDISDKIKDSLNPSQTPATALK